MSKPNHAAHNAAPTDGTIRPCSHMRVLVSALSDGNLTGLLRWVTEKHVAGCPRCAHAVRTLEDMETQLRDMGMPAEPAPLTLALSPGRWAVVEAGWAETDETLVSR